MKVIKKKLGKNIVNIRKEKDISQEKLGELANLHRTYIGSVERGERNISLEAMVKIAKALEVEIVNLFDGIILFKK